MCIRDSVAEAQGPEQTRGQVIVGGHAGLALQNGRQHVAVHAVVVELGPGLKQHVGLQKRLHPVRVQHAAHLAEVGAAAHGQQMAHLSLIHI